MPVFPGAEAPEILRGFGASVLEQLHLDAPRRRPADGHVEKHDRITSCDRLKRGEVVGVWVVSRVTNVGEGAGAGGEWRSGVGAI